MPFRSRDSITATARSICSIETGRLVQARTSPAISLLRSNGCRDPSRLTTNSGVSSIRSNVVKRWLQSWHSRRRRMAPLPATRESTTLVSPCSQYGQVTELSPDVVVWNRPEPPHLVAGRVLCPSPRTDSLLAQRCRLRGQQLADRDGAVAAGGELGQHDRDRLDRRGAVGLRRPIPPPAGMQADDRAGREAVQQPLADRAGIALHPVARP